MNSRCLALLLIVCCVPSITAKETPKSLVVMLDGVRADALRMAKTPAIDSLRDGSWVGGYKGAWTYAAHTIKDAPSDSAPNHTAIATGVTATKSQVKSNGLFPDYNKKNANKRYKHYLSRIEFQHPEKTTVFIHGWPPTGILMQQNNTCDLLIQGKDPENADRVVQLLAGIFEADGWETGTDVDALCFYIDKPDGAGHRGGFSPPGEMHDGYLQSIAECDGWIGNMLDAIRNRPNFDKEDWQIIICADHGGWNGGHGYPRAETYTVPLVVSGKAVRQGVMPGQACTTDVAVTVLDHFGFDIEKMKADGILDGSVRGKTESVSVAKKSPNDGLLVYLPLDGALENQGSDKSVQATNHHATLKTEGGKKNGYLEIRPAETPMYVSLGNPESLQWNVGDDFSFAFWIRMPEMQKGDPVVLGNKDWANGKNPGVLFFATGEKTGSNNNIGLNLADSARNRVDVKQFTLSCNAWWFCACSVDRQGGATLYLGSPDGKLFFGSMDLTGTGLGRDGQLTEGLPSPLPWNIGQDGTGTYGPKLSADLDELRIWNRALCLEEMEEIFQKP